MLSDMNSEVRSGSRTAKFGQATSRRVFKALGVFGSVQIVNVLCSVVRTKCIALWLGTAGIGIFGLYNNAIEVINQLVQLNIRQSGVREIVGAPQARFSVLVTVVRRLSGLLGLIGAFLVLLLAPVLSRVTFDDTDHTVPFVALSIVVFLSSVISGEQAVLQASERFRRLASASMWGGVAATVISIMLIWFWGYDGIVPSIISFSVCIFIAYFIVRGRVKGVARLQSGEMRESSLPILRLGMFMTAAMFITQLFQYLFLVWLGRRAGDDMVGVYQAGYTIINQYVGLIFAAIAIEYYPRIAAVEKSNNRLSLFVRHEMSMLMWGLLAAVVLFINIVPLIVRVLYSDAFLASVDYITIASVGTIPKAVSFVMAYVILARGDGVIYLLTESLSSVLYLVLCVAGFRNGSLAGLGCAYVMWYVLYTIIVFAVYRCRYHMGGVGRPLSLSLSVSMIVAAQATVCYQGYYLAATIVSCVVVPVALTMFYFLFLKRKTLKE